MYVDNLTVRSWDGDSWETEAEEFFETDDSNYAAERLLYDAAGNLVYDGEYQYTFDAWNRLVKVQRAWRDSSGDLATGSVVALLAYDGQGRRIQKEIQNSADTDATYHYYYSRGWQVLEERNGSGDCLRQYVWGARYVDNPIQIGINTDPSDHNEGPGENQCLVEDFYWPVQDANFNVLGLLASDGTLHERYEYTPYGERTVYMRAGSADEKTSAPLYESQRVEVASVRQPYGLCDLGHQGLALDKEFGQYDNRNRQYLFRSARFLNRDPVGYANGMSLYEYCRSAPPALVDPQGEFVVEALIVVIAAAVALSSSGCDEGEGIITALECDTETPLTEDPRVQDALKALNQCRKGLPPGAARQISKDVSAGRYVGNPKAKGVGVTLGGGGKPGTVGARLPSVIGTHPDLNAGDIAMELFGEHQRRHESKTPLEEKNRELERLEGALQEADEGPSMKMRHPR